MNRDLLDVLICPLTGSRLNLTSFVQSGDETLFGTLTGDGGEYPILHGIPILKSGQAQLVERLRDGEYALATAAACVESKYVPVFKHFMESRRLFRRLRRFTRPWEASLRAGWLSRAAEAIDDCLSSGSAQDLFHFFYRNCGVDSPEPYYYNVYRFGMPGQFVALSFSHALSAQSGFVLDHSCGAGHLTWGLSESVQPAQLIGQDISFFNLLAAKHFVARKGWFVCSGIDKLPFRDGIFSAVMNSDAYTNFSAKLGSFEEMVRCSTPDATILLVWMRNRNRHHLYPNKPLTPEAYCRIVSRHRYRLIPDPAVLEQFLAGSTVDATAEYDAEQIRTAITLSLWIEKGDGSFPQGRRFTNNIVPAEEVAMNPIYRPAGASPERSLYRLQFPSKFYAEEDREMKHYYPASISLSAEQRRALEEATFRSCLTELMRTGAVVGLPKRYLKTNSLG